MPKAFRRDPETGEWVEYDPKAYSDSAAKAAEESQSHSIKRKDLEEYAATVDQLGENARQSLETVLTKDLGRFSKDMDAREWLELREVLIEDLYQTRLHFGDAAGLAAAQFYDKTITNRAKTGVFHPAQLPEQVSRKVCADCVRALAKLLFQDKVDEFVLKVCLNAQNGVRRVANDTVVMNARRDGTKGVRYARVPVGAETCAFCIMLASRGFVYYSKESAGENEHMHKNCDCKIVAGFEGDTVEGYDSNAYLNMYVEAIKQSGSRKRDDVLRYMRREMLYPVYKDHINEVKRDWWDRNKDEQNAKRRKKKGDATV